MNEPTSTAPVPGLAASNPGDRTQRPRVRHGFMYWFGRAWLGMHGWELVGERPACRKCIVIGAPHTSNWDLPFSLAIAGVLGFQLHWLGKESLFKFPMGWLMRHLGGIAIERSGNNRIVERVVREFNGREDLCLAVAPEGTRGKSSRWKTGFYHMAVGAGVPIQLAFLDYGKKRGGMGPLLQPTGDLEADVAQMRAFYQGVKGRRPECQGDVEL